MKRTIKSILCTLICLLFFLSSFGCSISTESELSDSTTYIASTQPSYDDDSIQTIDDNHIEDVTISDEVQQIVDDTSEAIEFGEDLASSEIIESSIEEEKTLENDAAVEQENVSYDGASSKKGLDLIGPYQG